MTQQVSRRDVMIAGAAFGALTLPGQAEGKADGAAKLDAARAPGGTSPAAAAFGETAQVRQEVMKALRLVSGGDHYGRDPHDALPGKPDWQPFRPRYISILYLRLEANWSLAINHASFRLGQANEEGDRLKLAVDILNAKGNKNLGHQDLMKFGTYKYTKPNAHHQQMHTHDSTWFTDFNFASQTELFIYIDNSTVFLEDGDLMEFKLFGAGPDPKWPNYAYFNARQVTGADLKGLPGRLIRVENYMTKEDGQLITTENRWYSMNIKFRAPAGDAGMITMLIDPDTGNGAGNEP